MHVTVHGGCANIVRNSAPEVEWKKNSLPHRGVEPASAAHRTRRATNWATSSPHVVCYNFAQAFSQAEIVLQWLLSKMTAYHMCTPTAWLTLLNIKPNTKSKCLCHSGFTVMQFTTISSCHWRNFLCNCRGLDWICVGAANSDRTNLWCDWHASFCGGKIQTCLAKMSKAGDQNECAVLEFA